ncbi:Flp family type IVb pilin [Yoonia sp.]|uniref:Flp family type IVb pilin n=1 Tax=Yoonia sp. TaxID=2212373 RepID=UPI0019E973AE|nr:Flp family type IVb pilin [Yoonia sp.]MBE0413734.1 Flp family type IVb pilin [Yoonia sp.]
MKKFLAQVVRDESGAALVEYGVALLVVILVGTTALITLSNDTGKQFTDAAAATTAVVGNR